MSQTKRRLGELLAERDFRLLLGAQCIAQMADGLAQVAFAEEIVLDPQGTPTRTLALFALTLLPYSLLGPFTGVLVDRWPRRSILVWANVARAVLLVSLPLWMGALPGDTALYAGVLLLLGFGRLFLTTKGASLPVVLHEHHLLRGNSVSGGGGMISALVGGVAGIGVAAIVSTETAFIIAGLLYTVGALVARRISNPMAHPHKHLERVRDATARIATELVEGVREIWGRERARLPLFGIFVLRVAAMFVALIAIEVIRTEYTATDDSGRLSASALALGAAGVGAFIGALTAPAMGRRFSTPALLIIGFVVSGASMLVAAPVLDLTTTVGLTLFGGFGAFVAKVAVDAQVQEALPDEFRGRAFALYDILYNLASVVAALFLVAFFESSLGALLATGGALVLVLAWLLATAMKRAGMFLRPETRVV
ncbi:MAG TPA: MFS transporter [Actinomycetota bacterium]|nr:MFS transporter [Actinomycetota bacterium]